MDDIDRSSKTDPTSKRTGSIQSTQQPKEIRMNLDAAQLEEKPHLRNSVRTTRTLQEHLKQETLPSADNYHPHFLKIGSRATLAEVHLGETFDQKDGEGGTENVAGGVKFGWIRGVLVRCLLNIWGVMLFLRLSWVVGEAGIGQAILIILLATAVTTLTTLSMSAISTNGQIKGGGTYYMISRSLGPEFGGAVGIIFALGNAMGIALYIVGFCESLTDMLEDYWGAQIVDGGLNDIRIIGSITLVVLAVIVSIGMEWESKAQLLFLGLLLTAMLNYFVGSILGPSGVEEIAKGFVGYNAEVIATNFYADYRIFDGFQQNFFSVFAVFFPAATGILAGASISGDLKNPSTAIPKGTLLAIAISSSFYVLFAVIAGAAVLRDATGNPADYNNTNGTIDEYMDLCIDRDCEWGLQNSYQVMTLVSAFGPLNYVGCFAATLSSALASFVSAPKVFQSLCNDRIFPYLHWFGKGYGKNQEPLRAYALAFLIALACILIAELDVIALLITNCYLASYGMVNFATFHVDLFKPVGWRPTFRYYNKWLSLLGFGLSVATMFLCSWPTALVTAALSFALFFVVRYRKLDINWGSSTQVQVYKTALTNVQQFCNIDEHTKTYTPQILVMTGPPNMRPSLVDFAYLLCKNNSLMVCGDIVQERQNIAERSYRVRKSLHWLRAHKAKAFYSLVDNLSFSSGVGALLQATGIGKMKPNILLLGYQSTWRASNNKEIEEYFVAINTALEMHVAVTILRVQEGLDYEGIIGDYNMGDFTGDKRYTNGIDNLSFADSSENCNASNSKPFTIGGSMDTILTDESVENMSKQTKKDFILTENATKDARQKNMKKSRIIFKDPQGKELSTEVQNSICRFRMKQKRGTIDVWWLYDDGGLSMLLPYILTTRSNWANSKLRVFCLAEADEEQEHKKKTMRLLLSKFRILVSDVVVIPDLTANPSSQTKAWFDDLTREFVRKDDDPSIPESNVPVIKQSELLAEKPKTFNFMRLRELLMQHSADANLIVMTLPIPQKGKVSGPLYMSWLETLTSDMPPFLLVRGNHTSVLTYHS